MSWGLAGRPHTLHGFLFAWEQRLRRLPSVRDWARTNGWPGVGRRGKVPVAALRAYRRHHRVLTPYWRAR